MVGTTEVQIWRENDLRLLSRSKLILGKPLGQPGRNQSLDVEAREYPFIPWLEDYLRAMTRVEIPRELLESYLPLGFSIPFE